MLAEFGGLTLALGTMPGQLMSTLSVLLPKPTSGFRTVGLFPALYRALIKQQGPALQKWEAEHPTHAFPFREGKIPSTRSGLRRPRPKGLQRVQLITDLTLLGTPVRGAEQGRAGECTQLPLCRI